MVEGNSIALPNLQLGRRYFWRVRPFNYYASCAPVSPRFTFIATASTSTKDLNLSEGIQITPNLIGTGETIYIRFAQPRQEKVVVRLLDVNGKMLDSKQYNAAYDLEHDIQVNGTGLYLLQIIVDKEQVVKKIVIQ